ncbi:MAG TPA: hypothetical protein VK211_16945, partial [Kamptonema sp.]|nr:hypothetical protein [Kamptonema sp.]
TSQRYIVFRDRDFDVQPTSTTQLLQLGNRLVNRTVALTYRSCIENYLLDPGLIHTYWTEKYSNSPDSFYRNSPNPYSTIGDRSELGVPNPHSTVAS